MSQEDVERYRAAKRLFLAARERTAAERASFLSEQCGADAALRLEVEELLESDADGGLEALAVGPERVLSVLRGLELGTDENPEPSLPERIGDYRPIEVLGRGAMAVVYLAEEDVPRRLVALKVLRGDVSDGAQRRIEQEAELLAQLEHPGIASVYAAGRADTPWGRQPFLAMEYVGGRSLLRYAREESLSPEQCVRLVVEIADALQVAHARGIVHRDLKPSNVLVDAHGQPKLLDFGVARWIDRRDAVTAHTETGQIVGTLATMSPEQAAGALAIDARADVYALGVLLYELCSGRLPIDTRALPLHEAVRQIQTVEPVSLGAVVPSLRGDVETIVGKALSKEPPRRYPNAGAFADDLRRHLENRLIEARRPGMLDRAQRFGRRHRALVWSVTGVILSLTIALGVTLVALRRAQVQSLRALSVRNAVLRLSDLRRLEHLERQADALWPAVPERLQAMDDWLVEARLLERKLPFHREFLATIQARLDSPEGRALSLKMPGAFARDDVMLRDAQADLVAGLERFAGPDGRIAELQARRARAASVVARTTSDPPAAAAWEAARAVVADAVRAPRYAEAVKAGFALEPRVGLFPMGLDEPSGLYAFALAAAEPDADVGSHRKPALALLLLPPDPAGPALLVAREPLRVGQWAAIAAMRGILPPELLVALHPEDPLGFLDAAEAERGLANLGLRLPREAEWERARAAGLTRGLTGFREWCADRVGVEQVVRDGGDAEAGAGSDGAARRRLVPPAEREADLGVRPVRDWTP